MACLKQGADLLSLFESSWAVESEEERFGQGIKFLVQQRSRASTGRKASYVVPVELLSFGIARNILFSLLNEEHSNRPTNC